MNIYVIGGKAGSGKSILGKYLKKELELMNHKVIIMQITAPLYFYAKTYFSWNGDMNNKPRCLLQNLGIDIIRNKLNKPHFLLKRLYEDIEILSNYFDTFIITDARLIDEFTSIQKKYQNVTTIKVIRNNYDNNLSEKEKQHITETEIMDYNKFDYIIENKSLDIIKKEAKIIAYKGGKL